MGEIGLTKGVTIHDTAIFKKMNFSRIMSFELNDGKTLTRLYMKETIRNPCGNP